MRLPDGVRAPLVGPNAAFIFADRDGGRDTLRYSVCETDYDTPSHSNSPAAVTSKSESL